MNGSIRTGIAAVACAVVLGTVAVVTTGAFESEEAFQATADLAREMDATPDGLSDLEISPREVHFLVSR